jgi:hypothetical protein
VAAAVSDFQPTPCISNQRIPNVVPRTSARRPTAPRESSCRFPVADQREAVISHSRSATRNRQDPRMSAKFRQRHRLKGKEHSSKTYRNSPPQTPPPWNGRVIGGTIPKSWRAENGGFQPG